LGVPPSDGFLRRAPSELGLDARALGTLFRDVEAAGMELQAFMLWRDGAVAAEGWKWPYGPRRRRMTHSVTKSFTACAIGLLVDNGAIALTDPISRFFPEARQADPQAAAITVEDLLTMRSGHGAEVSGAVWRGIGTSWIEEFFRIPLAHAPGTEHVYSSAASYMLSAIVTRVTGETLHAWLAPRLFRPLGIEDETWDLGPDGINPGGNGLSLTTADALKLGVLHAQGGVWNGRRILPAWWAEAATKPQGAPTYGYHWVIGDGYYAALGVMVQMVLVFPTERSVIAVNAAIQESALLLPHLRRRLPEVFAGAPSVAGDRELARGLSAWSDAPGFMSSSTPARPLPSHVTWNAAPNAVEIESIACRSDARSLQLTLTDWTGAHSLVAGWGHWREGRGSLPAPTLHHGYALPDAPVAAGARWIAPDTIEIVAHFLETAFRDRIVLRLAGDRVTLDRSVNMNVGERAWPTIAGRR
jgi:CubicO group peptidase (beta-lactamase class C family)